MHPVTGMAAEQAMVHYLDDARRVHDDLRRLLTQVSGFALMLMTSPARRVLPDASLRDAATHAARVAEAVRALAVPQAAEHHHHHLAAACASVGRACTMALTCAAPGAGGRERDVLVETLDAAVTHLRAISRLLPGFEPVRFDQACCAVHAQPAA